MYIHYKQVIHGALLGDTSAVCRVGFKESVGFADRKCRHCIMTDSQIQKVTIISILNFFYRHSYHNRGIDLDR